MNKVFELYIANALRDEERYAVLDLPATPYEMLDALERAGCRSSEEAYFQVEEYLDFEYLESVIPPHLFPESSEHFGKRTVRTG